MPRNPITAQAVRMAQEWAAANPSDPYAYVRALARLKAGIACVEAGKIVSLD